MTDKSSNKLYGGKDGIAKQFEFEAGSFSGYSYAAIMSMLNRFECNLYNMGVVTTEYPTIGDLYDAIGTPKEDRVLEILNTRLQFTFVILITDPITLLSASLAFSFDGLSRENIIAATCSKCSRVITECAYLHFNGEKSLRSDISKSTCRYCSKLMGE